MKQPFAIAGDVPEFFERDAQAQDRRLVDAAAVGDLFQREVGVARGEAVQDPQGAFDGLDPTRA